MTDAARGGAHESRRVRAGRGQSPARPLPLQWRLFMPPVSSTTAEREFPLGFEGFSWSDLHDPVRLKALLDAFDAQLAREAPELHAGMMARRAQPDGRDPIAESHLLVELAPRVSAFLARLFGIESQWNGQRARAAAEAKLFAARKEIVGRRAAKFKGEAATVDFPALHRELLAAAEAGPGAALPGADEELRLGLWFAALLDAESELVALAAGKISALSPATREFLGAGDPPLLRGAVASQLEKAARWAASALHGQGRAATRGWALTREPEKLDFQNLVQIIRPDPALKEKLAGPDEKLRRRDGFDLTDPRPDARAVAGEVHYCLLCGERDKDSCSKGLRDKSGAVLKSPFAIPLVGCPLGEKISEMHALRRRGDAIGAVALAAIDNPMLPGTGHRICNDCMHACIYQKQEPVNIPAAETGALTDLYALPYGFEIWSLLTRWNPLNARRPVALPYNGKKVLVVGMGPAGYTLAHHLLNEGFAVVGIDGLKIEPLDPALTGADGQAPRPVVNYRELEARLSSRRIGGFGGVSEYGITVRWDKNFLTALQLNLARRAKLTIAGGVRFGGTVTTEQAWGLGFDHIALAAGAGRPTIVPLKNNLIRGVRQASDFLMGLQLTGAAQPASLANLQIRLPVVVVGGGLTAIDTATEALAYYPVLCEKILARHEGLVAELGEARALARYDGEETAILEEFRGHARALRAERARARAAGEPPDFVSLLRSWGGSSIAYRKKLQDSPAYRLNHEEIIKALEEGIHFIEGLEPAEALADEHGALRAVVFKKNDGSTVELPCRTLLIAAGTSPNTTSEKEARGTFEMDAKGNYFKAFRARVEPGGWVELEPGDGDEAIFTSYHRGGKFISFFGDNHPRYAGNVVKAMASAKNGFPHIAALFGPYLKSLNPADQSRREVEYAGWSKTLDDLFIPRVTQVNRLTKTIVEVVVRAPYAARNFRPGQFYRLQNYEGRAPVAAGSPLATEPLALTGAWVDPEKGLLSMIALELGVSSRLCAALKPGEPVIVMGPTGTPTHIPESETVCLVGGGLGNAVLFSIARACREKGNRVLYFAGYKHASDLFKREEIEAATDCTIFSVDPGNGEIAPRRPQDRFFSGNIVQSMKTYATGGLGETPIPLRAASRIIVIGSDRMMAAVKRARHEALAPFLRPDHEAIGSINSPMQCMMKEICAQCLQRHVDPETGKESFVFSCFNQDQCLDRVDFIHLNARLRQNSLQEKQTLMWFEHLIGKAPVARV